MNKPKFILSIIFLLLVGMTNVFAQSENEKAAQPNREIILQVLVASDSPNQKTKLPPALANTTKKLNSLYPFADYRLAMSYFERVAVNGSIEYRGVANNFSQNQNEELTVFPEWSLHRMQILPDSQNQNVAQFQNFRFGMRLPITTSTLKKEDGQINRSINYEQIGLTIQKFNVPENTPTIIGSMTSSQKNETIFLILTVNSNVN